ncbi:molybdate ABC transporter substrate-binding protein [Leucobacter sp. GX24907]
MTLTTSSRPAARRRTLGALALMAGAALALAGCASGSSDESDTTEPAETSELSGELTVYAAASLEPAFQQLAEDFTAEHPDVSFDFSFDGSSVLVTQIIGGAPADVFASADEPNMTKLTDEGLNDGDPIGFATSELAIAVAPDNPLGIETLEDLAGDDVTTVICDPEVPCGNASHTLLDRDGVDLTPASEEQNVTAVLTKVSEGEADAGLVYYSDILRAEGDVEGIEIENASDAAGDYLIVPVVDSPNAEAAAAFSEFLVSDEAQALFAELGFGPAR